MRKPVKAEAMTDMLISGQAIETETVPQPGSAPTPRKYGAFNTLGLMTLLKREIGRYIKVATQTIFAPVVSTVLFMIVFKLAYPARADFGWDGVAVSFNDFIAPGLVMMAILNNSFQNTSSSLTIAKVNGTQVDFLMPPLTPLELTIGFVVGACTRGLIVAFITALVIHITGLASMSVVNFLPIAYFGIMAAITLSAIGAMGGIWADKFDHLAAVSQFVILPLTFLSGTFYRIEALAEPFESLTHGNPMFYLIDGFRYGFIGVADSNITIGVFLCGGFALACCFGVWLMFRTGYKLKA
ncbi:MAG: ABC transporter permease [Pseudomonadota bacterium]